MINLDRPGDVTMSTIIRAESSEQDRQVDALCDRELSNVTGGKGKASPGDFVFVHLYDKASPVLAK
jgi:type VI protein secretion system component Hcp